MKRLIDLESATRYFCKTFDIQNPHVERRNSGRHSLVNGTFQIKFSRDVFHTYSYYTTRGEEVKEVGESINSAVADKLYSQDILQIYFVYPDGTIMMGQLIDFIFDGVEREVGNEYTLSIPLRWLKVLKEGRNGKENNFGTGVEKRNEIERRQKQITLGSV